MNDGLTPKLKMVSVIPKLLTLASATKFGLFSRPATMACCPPGSWGELKPDADYENKGAVEKLSGLDIYVTGKMEGGRCVIWNYDIFGFDGGRTRQLCDILGEQGRTFCSMNCGHES